MYAIVEIAGQQFKVAKDQKVYVHRLQGAAGSEVTFENVMLIEDKGNVTIGAPAIEGATVTAKILTHLQGDKVIVFKKKPASGAKKSAKKEAAPKKKAAPKAEVKEATTDYSSMTVAQLKVAAKEKGITGYTSKRSR